jgi:hypothetical protein
MTVRPVLFISFLLSSAILSTLKSQEMLGVVNSNFGGVKTAMMNPANTGTSEQLININLLAGDLFLSSNYIYIHKKDYGFLKIFRVNMSDPQYLYTYEYPGNYTDSVYYFDYYKNSKSRYFYQNTRLAGPSILYHKGNDAYSLVTGLRSVSSVEKLPDDLANFIYRGMQFRPQHSETYTDGWSRFTSLTWFEAGLGYTRTIFERYDDALYAGITAKLLLGLAGAYGLVDNVTYMIPSADTIIVYNLNSRFGFSLPLNTASNAAELDPLVKGKGFSFDAGITYVRMKDRKRNYRESSGLRRGISNEYHYKAGISLLDMGFISFNQFVEVHEFNDVNNRIWPGLLSFNPSSLQDVIRSASYNLLGDSLASQTDATKFKIWLPSALSLQFDYNAGNNIFVNATVINGVRFAQPSVRRSSLIAVTPRYEAKYFEVSLPVSLFDYRDLQLGMALRIFNLVIGTEKLGTFLHLTDVNGMDIYFALGFNLNPKSKEKTCESYQDYKRYQTK